MYTYYETSSRKLWVDFITELRFLSQLPSSIHPLQHLRDVVKRRPAFWILVPTILHQFHDTRHVATGSDVSDLRSERRRLACFHASDDVCSNNHLVCVCFMHLLLLVVLEKEIKMERKLYIWPMLLTLP